MHNSNTNKIYIGFGTTVLLCIFAFIQITRIQDEQRLHQRTLDERRIFMEETKRSLNELMIRLSILERANNAR